MYRHLLPAVAAAASVAIVLTAQLVAAESSRPRLTETAPACAHDPTKWHGLVEYNPDGSVKCTYDHDHGSDPHALDDRLGPLPVPEISYPWQTHNHTTGAAENDAKHRVYSWMIARDQPCVSRFSRLSMTSVRMAAHADGNSGAATRSHSYWAQARLCDTQDPSYAGSVSIGGHIDFGTLFVRERTADGSVRDVRVPLPGDPSTSISPNIRRLHGSPSYKVPVATWYGANATEASQKSGPRVDIGTGWVKEDWGPVDPSDPTRPLFYGGAQNGSSLEPIHSLAITVSPFLDKYVNGTPTGRVTYEGFTDVYGNLAPTCTAASTDCVPLSLVNAKVGYYQFRYDDHDVTHGGTLTIPDSDVLDNTGHSLIRFPN